MTENDLRPLVTDRLPKFRNFQFHSKLTEELIGSALPDVFSYNFFFQLHFTSVC